MLRYIYIFCSCFLSIFWHTVKPNTNDFLTDQNLTLTSDPQRVNPDSAGQGGPQINCNEEVLNTPYISRSGTLLIEVA